MVMRDTIFTISVDTPSIESKVKKLCGIRALGGYVCSLNRYTHIIRYDTENVECVKLLDDCLTTFAKELTADEYDDWIREQQYQELMEQVRAEELDNERWERENYGR